MDSYGKRPAKIETKSRSRIFFWLAALVLIALTLSNFEYELDSFSPTLAGMIKEQTSLEAEFTGGLTLRPSLWPTLKLAGLRLHSPQAPGFSLLGLKDLELRLNLLSLLSGGLRLESLRAEDLNLQTEFFEELGGKNADRKESAQSGLNLPALEIAELDLRRVRLIQGRGSGTKTLLSLERLQGGLGQDDPCFLQAKGVFQGKPANLSLDADSLAGLSQQGVWELKGLLGLDQNRTHFELSLSTPLDPGHIQANFTLSSPGLAGLHGLTGLDLGPLGPVDLRGSVELRPDWLELTGMEGTLAGGGIKGRLRLKKEGGNLETAGRVELREVDLKLSRAGKPKSAEPHLKLERAQLDFEGLGPEIQAVLRDMNAHLELENGHFVFDRPGGALNWALDQGRLTMEGSRGSRFRAKGRIQKQPFELDAAGGGLYALVTKGESPFQMSGRCSGARLSINGLYRTYTENSGPYFKLKLQTGDVSSLQGWLGFKAGAKLPLDFESRVKLSRREARLDDLSLSVGPNLVRGRISYHDKPGPGRWQVSLSSERLELDEVLGLLASPAKTQAQPKAQNRDMNQPLWSPGSDLPDVDFDLQCGLFKIGPREISRAHIKGNMTAGVMKKTRLTATYRGLDISGSLDADLSGAAPQAGLKLGAKDVNLRSFLRREGLPVDVPFKTESIDLDINLKGNTIAELLTQSELSLSLGPGDLVFLSPHASGRLPLKLTEAKISLQKAETLRAEARARLWGDPVDISFQAGPLKAFKPGSGKLEVWMKVAAPRAKLTLDGSLTPPLKKGPAELKLRLAGPDLSLLTTPPGTNLPAWGPYQLSSDLRMDQSGYGFSGMELRIGQSRLQGEGKLWVRQGRPKLELKLVAPEFQMDDFRVKAAAEPSPKADKAEQTPKPASGKPGNKKPGDKSTPEYGPAGQNAPVFWPVLENMLTALIEKVDATVLLEAKQVRSGQDRLGDGVMTLKADRKGVVLRPFQVRLPGGAVNLGLELEPIKGLWREHLWAKVRNFNYGVLARRWQEGSQSQGVLNLNLDLKGDTPSLQTFLAHANGQFDFVVLPENMSAEFMQSWVIGLIDMLLPRLDKSSGSKLNCLVGLFDVKNGVMKDKVILMDTTGAVVRGHGEINLKDRTLKLLMRPQPKSARLFTFSTGLLAQGPINDIEVTAPSGELLGGLFSFLTSPFHVPVQRLGQALEDAPQANVCTRALHKNASK